MTLELIGAGFGRTGTMSTREALALLGYPCYHMATVMEDGMGGEHLQFWSEVAAQPEGVSMDWQRVFGEVRATIDFPAACVWRELMRDYPGAKVLLTVHPGGAEAWYDSAWETIYFTQRYWQFRLLRILPPYRRFAEMVQTLVWHRALGDAMPDRAHAVAQYEAHLRRVQAEVPPERLLLFSVKDGWEPLCTFLGVPVPDVPFPRVNERRTFRRTINLGRAAVLGILALGTLGLVAVGAWLFGFMG